MRRTGLAAAFTFITVVRGLAAEDQPGQQVFQRNCAVCHDNGTEGGRMPATAGLRRLAASAIERALESGVMQAQGANLTAAERSQVAAYLGVASVSAAATFTNNCPAEAKWQPSPAEPKWDGWGVGTSNRRYSEEAGLAARDVAKLKLRWAFALPNATTVRSQPAVYGGRVFIGAPDGAVYALSARTGCTHWSARVASQVRSGVAIANNAGRILAVVGDAAGNLTALDAATGTTVWTRHVDASPYAMVTSTPLVHNGRIYLGVSSREEPEAAKQDYICCTFRGSVLALKVADGTVIWKTWTTPEPPTARGKNKRGRDYIGPSGAGVWATPTFDPARNLLYVMTGDNFSDPVTDTSDALLALAPDDGHIVWSKQFTKNDAYNGACNFPTKFNCPDSEGPDHDFGASAILVGRTLLLGQKSGVMHAVDADRKGEILWQARVGKGGPLGGIQWGPASDGRNVYAALSDTTDQTGTGGLFAFAVANGERIWQVPNKFCEGKTGCRPAQSAAVTAIPGAVFSGSMDGHLRAYNTTDGTVIWDFDAVREFKTVNGIQGNGGSFDAGGPVVVGGMVFAGSGYSSWGGIPGNVLLAFGPE